MAHQSFAKTVLEMLTKETLVRDGEVSVDELSIALHLTTRKDHKRMLNTLSDLVKSGRAVRVRQGVYTWSTQDKEPDKREVMWRTIRMRRNVTIADLQEFAGVSHDYAKEWLGMLVRRGIAMRCDSEAHENLPSHWALLKNDAEMPVDTDKAAKLRNIRLKKKKIVARLDSIGSALGEVRQILQTMEDD
jgi:hypothetical protein